MPRQILVVVEHRRGHGTGHLRRCAALSAHLEGDIFWLLPQNKGDGWYTRQEVCEILAPAGSPRWVEHPRGTYDLVLVDCRSFSGEDLKTLPPGAVVIGLDAPPPLRRYASFLVDSLPAPPGALPANITDPGFLPLPERLRQDWPRDISRILVVFGGEPRDDQVRRVAARALIACRQSGRQDVVVEAILGEPAPMREIPQQMRSGEGSFSGVREIPLCQNLAETLADYDLVITHFGLLAWEALWARVPVVTVNPSRYHRSLSRRAGITTARSLGDLARLIKREYPRILQSSRAVRPREKRSLPEFLNALVLPERVTSPSESSREGPRQPALQRFSDRTFFRNLPDGLVFLQNFVPQQIDYSRDYFFSEYQAQYGRTYLEDFDAIARMGDRRIADILGRCRFSWKAPKLLDIGCAFGPFLVAASRAGCRVLGFEINREAVRHIRDELGLEAHQGDLMHLEEVAPQGPFDIVTLWYVIEHIQDLDLFLQKVHTLLRPGGILAFSTPHGRGISARRDRRAFLSNSPRDHYSVWDISSARRVLKKYGFSLRALRVTGHHPERFSPRLSRRWYPFLSRVSRIARLGDTFEVIAERL
ncbi:Methyltransferase domain-containing protein [Alkalispirochaeta americana]|uniref:Methyltransferase domain-containing protein n=1 Tax=Alkalispirochaeta americana TaxID=159291 RepID=A0A1N6PAS9_9SPIO|nr:class I SAM-dependent methyltransferase [Alkalispirochaeta americana]SIQ01480.1 Methyltransferase domain-containing protein [Alkalispirochaeta americana]